MNIENYDRDARIRAVDRRPELKATDMTSKRYETPASWYAALDAIVAEISEREGVQPVAVNYEAGGHVAYADWLIEGDTGTTFLAVVLDDELDSCEQMRFPVTATETVDLRPEWWAEEYTNDEAAIDDARTWAWFGDAQPDEPAVAHHDLEAGTYTLYSLGAMHKTN